MDDLARLTFSNLKDPNQEGIYLTDSSTEATFNKILRAINTITENKNVWASAYSKNEKSGYMERSVFVPKASLEALMARLSSLQAELQAKDTGFNFQADRNIRTLSTDINLTGTNALSKASLRARELGGSFDRATGAVQIPLSSKTYESITSGGTQAAYIANQFRDAKRVSDETARQREEVRREREAEKAVREEAKREAKSQKTNAWFKSEGERAAAKEYQKQLDKSKQKEEDDKENKKENFLSSFLKDPLVKILTFFGLTVSLLRRIILNLPKQAIETAKEAQRSDAQTALALGLTKRQMRDFKIFEAAHDLDAGTFANAVKEVNETFGRIDKLENDSVQVRNMAKLGTAAYGAKGSGKANEFIQRLVTMDITQEQPDVLLAEIVNAATEAYNKRMNLTTMSSVDANGVPYSSEASMRSILSYLEEAGLQEAAVLFLQKIHDTESGYYGQIGDYASWLKSTRTNITGLSDADLDALVIMGKEFNAIAAKLKDITDSVLTRFANSLVRIAGWIENQRWFMSASERRALDRENKKLNEAALKQYTALSSSAEEQFAEKYKTVTGRDFTGSLSNITKEDLLAAGADKELIALLGNWRSYNARKKEAEKQLQNAKEGKDVYWDKAWNTLEFMRVDAQDEIKSILEWLYGGEIGTNKTVATGSSMTLWGTINKEKRELYPVEKKLADEAWKEYTATSTPDFTGGKSRAQLKGLSEDEKSKVAGGIFSDKMLKKIISMYEQRMGRKVNKDFLFSSIAGGDSLLGVEALQLYANELLSSEDKAALLNYLGATWSRGSNVQETKGAYIEREAEKAADKSTELLLLDKYSNEINASILRNEGRGYTYKDKGVRQDETSRKAEVYVRFVDSTGKIVKEVIASPSITGVQSTTELNWADIAK